MLKKILLASFALVLTAPAMAQSGDREGHKMVEVWRDMDVPPAPVLSPEEALKSFTVQEGFKIELVAAEPYVEDPVAMAFDEDGRIWVVEMRGFMPNVDGSGEDVRNGVVAVLEDRDGDGAVDRRTEFLTGLQMPRAVGFAQGGVLVAEPPHLWFCKDVDGDLQCDEKVEILDDYGLQGPVEHTDNGLLLGLDNWIYNAKSTKRIRNIDGEWVVENNFFRGQWGISQDNYGRLYYNNNSSPLFVDLVPAHYMTRNEHFDTKAGLDQPVFESRDVWPGRVNPGINRGYQEQMLRDGRLAVFTAACAPTVYRGDNYPEDLVGHALVLEPGGNLTRLQKVEFSNGAVYGENAYHRAEWLTSTDERFRPVNASVAPDGTVYLLDMYRGILQHKLYVTTFLRKQIIERGLDKPVGLGRIYRVARVDGKRAAAPRMSEESTAQLVAWLAHPNGWWRDTAQRVLIDRNDPSAHLMLREMARSDENHLARIHALWTLEGLSAVDLASVYAALQHDHPQVQIAGLRLAEVVLRQETEDEEEAQVRLSLLSPMFELEKTGRLDVIRQLVLSLSGMRLPQVAPGLRELVRTHGNDLVVRDGLVAGLEGRELEFLQRLLADSNWNKRKAHMATLIRNLAACVAREAHPYRVERLLEVAAKEPAGLAWRRKAILDGLADVANPSGRKPRPIHFEEQPLALVKLQESGDRAVRESLGKLENFLTYGAEAEPPPPPRPLTDREQALFDQGKMLFQLTCASCHLPSGLGEEGKAPPLVDSPILLGPEERLARIVLNGLTGPVTVHGRTYDMTMPALQGFDSEQIASILTYARRAWEHGGDPIHPETVAKIKETEGRREVPWTVEELEATLEPYEGVE